MKDIFSQIIDRAFEEANRRQEKCNCSVCALKKAAAASDSKEESKKLRQDADHMDAIRHNLLNFTETTLPGADKASEDLASKLDSMGYPESAEAARGYYKMSLEAKRLCKLISDEMDAKNPEDEAPVSDEAKAEMTEASAQ